MHLSYYAKRLDTQVTESGGEGTVQRKCPLCASPGGFTLAIEKDSWVCNQCGKSGDCYNLEASLAQCCRNDSFRRVMAIIAKDHAEEKQPVPPQLDEYSQHVYSDEFGNPIFRIVRRTWIGSLILERSSWTTTGGWQEAKSIPQVLYNLPQLIAAQSVVVVDDEPTADAEE